MANASGSSVQQSGQFEWPGWDKSLGAAPVIVLDKPPAPEQLEKFNQQLANIADLSRPQSAGALRDQLKAMSGEPIHIALLQGHDAQSLHNLTGSLRNADYIQPGDQPQIRFNPEAWGKYPAKGAQELEAPHDPSVMQRIKADYGTASMKDEGLKEINATRGKYAEYGISPPEQQFIHELGHYAMFAEAKHIYDKGLASALNNARYLEFSDPAYQQAKALIDKSTGPQGEVYVTDHYEVPAMKSISPGFIERDSRYYASGMMLPEGKNGVPDLPKEDQKALENALKIHPVTQASPDQSQAETADFQARAAQLTPEQKVAEASRYIQTLPEHQRAVYQEKVAQYANTNGLYIEEAQTQSRQPEPVRGT